MTGSLSQKHGKYYVIIRIPDSQGILKQKWINTGISIDGNNKRKAKQRMNEIISEYERDKCLYSDSVSFIDWFNNWMIQKKNEVRVNTFEGYQIFADKHIIPYFLTIKLSLKEVTGMHIQAYYNTKYKDGLSGNTIKKHSVLLRGAFDSAVKNSLIAYNPVDRATPPRSEKYIGQAYTRKQANMLLEAIDNEPLKPAIILGMFYGLRRSEVLGLRWRDIDFLKNTIQIRNTVVKMKTVIEKEQTKSRSSKRVLYIIPDTRDYFINLKEEQQKNQELFGDSYVENDHVCAWPDGRSFYPDYISQKFSKILKANDLPHIRFHELRHTAGSLLLEQGLSAKQIQEYLGHEQVSTTLDIYGHLSLEGKQEASRVMNGLLQMC